MPEGYCILCYTQYDELAVAIVTDRDYTYGVCEGCHTVRAGPAPEDAPAAATPAGGEA